MHSRLFTLSVLPFFHTTTIFRYNLSERNALRIGSRTYLLRFMNEQWRERNKKKQLRQDIFNAFYRLYRENKLRNDFIAEKREGYTRHTGISSTERRKNRNIKNKFIGGRRRMRKKTRSEYEQTRIEIRSEMEKMEKKNQQKITLALRLNRIWRKQITLYRSAQKVFPLYHVHDMRRLGCINDNNSFSLSDIFFVLPLNAVFTRMCNTLLYVELVSIWFIVGLALNLSPAAWKPYLLKHKSISMSF